MTKSSDYLFNDPITVDLIAVNVILTALRVGSREVCLQTQNTASSVWLSPKQVKRSWIHSFFRSAEAAALDLGGDMVGRTLLSGSPPPRGRDGQ